MKSGFVLTLVISVTFHATDYFLNDQKTWHDLVAGVAVDMAVVGAAIATSSAIIAMGGTLIAGIAIAPLIIVVSVGFLFSDTTAYVDYVIKSLRIAEKNIIDKKIIINNQIQQLEDS